jgi:Domain of unknown function (DUF4294)
MFTPGIISRFLLFSLLFSVAGLPVFANETAKTDTVPNMASSKYGKNDTIIVAVIEYQGEYIPYKQMEEVWISNMNEKALNQYKAEWTRLRNAIYVTYPYAKAAGKIFNEINAQMAGMTSRSQRKALIKSREKDLKREFADRLTELSVYQGRVLMKLINRETGNNCYEIIKEYKGGFTARFWQTIAFFFGSNLKQPYDAAGEDAQIERIVLEIERMYYRRG